MLVYSKERIYIVRLVASLCAQRHVVSFGVRNVRLCLCVQCNTVSVCAMLHCAFVCNVTVSVCAMSQCVNVRNVTLCVCVQCHNVSL